MVPEPVGELFLEFFFRGSSLEYRKWMRGDPEFGVGRLVEGLLLVEGHRVHHTTNKKKKKRKKKKQKQERG